MSSSLGYLPGQIKETCNNMQIDSNDQVIYNSPAGFNQLDTIAMANAPATMTAQQVLNGLVTVDGDGGPEDLSLPTAALLVGAMNCPTVNTSIRLVVRNVGGEIVTVIASTGTVIAVSGSAAIATVNTIELLIVLTNVTPGSEAATAYVIAKDNIH